MRIGFISSLFGYLRPAENIGVAAFANEKNSQIIKTSEASPGDVIIFLGTGRDNLYNHILVITAVEKRNNNTCISYAHSYAWPSDGSTGHGVRSGEILVRDENLINAIWMEKNITGALNYTYESACTAQKISVHRFKFNFKNRDF